MPEPSGEAHVHHDEVGPIQPGPASIAFGHAPRLGHHLEPFVKQINGRPCRTTLRS